MVVPTSIAWSPHSYLVQHWEDHTQDNHRPGHESQCWRNILHKTSVSVEDYKWASFRAWSQYIIEVSYVNIRPNIHNQPSNEDCTSRVDKFGIRTVVCMRNGKGHVKTCHHLHYRDCPRPAPVMQLQKQVHQIHLNAYLMGLESNHIPKLEDLIW